MPAAERAAESAALYRLGSYAPARGAVDRVLEPLRRVGDRARLRAVRDVPRGAAVLEVGAGDGRFLAALARAGYRPRGVDPFAAGDGVDPVGLEEAELRPGSSQAVVFWHVLEHLDEPAAALRRARKALVPGGAVVVAVPNAGSLQARIGGERWFQRDIPRHAVHFTERGLRLLLVRCGFEVVGVRQVAVEQNLLGMWQSLLNRLTVEQDVAFRWLKRSLPHRSRPAAALDLGISLVAGPLLVLPAAALELGAGLAGRGGSLVVQARRPLA